MELQPIDYTQHASSQLCQMSFSDLLNQTSNNFDYNINSNLTSTQELLSPTTSPTTSSTASSSQSSPLSESEKHQQYSNSHSGGLYSPTAYQDSLGTVSSYDVSSKHQKSFPLPVSSLNNTQSCHSTYNTGYQSQVGGNYVQMYYNHAPQFPTATFQNHLLTQHRPDCVPLPSNVQTPGSKLSRKSPKKKKKKDPNEPSRPVSAYALFFRETQSIIKSQKTDATFGEISKIVASMWDGLGENEKTVYKQKTENAKREYLRELAAYRASLVSNGPNGQNHNARSKPY